MSKQPEQPRLLEEEAPVAVSAEPALSEDAPRTERRSLPEANEFSPGQIELRKVLEIVHQGGPEHGGGRDQIVEALRQEYFSDSALKQSDPVTRLRVQRTRAGNVLVGLKGYGLFDLETNLLTPLGKELLQESDDTALYKRFAKHILINRHGITVLEAVDDLVSRQVPPSKANLQRELEGRNFQLPRATTYHTKMLQWLRKAGVLDRKGSIDPDVFQELTGRSFSSVRQWGDLTAQQRAFLRTLREAAESHGKDPIPAREVIDRSIFQHGPIFIEDQLNAKVFRPLEEQGWIARPSRGSGRGGKSGLVSATDKLLEVPIDALTRDVEWGIPSDLRPKLRTPLSDIQRDLLDPDKNIKGIALELLAIRLASDLALTPVRLRIRAPETGGAEVDLIAEGAHLHFSRWLFQCKNTGTVPLSDLAKEVGMAVLLRAHVIVIATTGRCSSTVHVYAKELAQTTALQVILLEGDAIDAYIKRGPQFLMNLFHDRAHDILKLKRDQIDKETAI